MKYVVCVSVVLFLNYSEAFAAPFVEHVLHKGDSEIVGWEVRSVINRNIAYRISGQDRTGLHRKEKDFLQSAFRLDNKAVSTLIDWHPLRGSFRTTIGVFVGTNDIDLYAAPDFNRKYDDVTFKIDKSGIPDSFSFEGGELDLSQLGIDEKVTLESASVDVDKEKIPDQVVLEGPQVSIDEQDINISGVARYKSFAPYFGIGWGNSPYSKSRLRYSVDIGVIYYGKPDLDITLDGKIVHIHPLITAELNDYVAGREQELQQKYSKYKLMPFLSFGLSLTF